MLKTEQNTVAMRKRVEKTARKYFQKRKGVNAYFEHGQWWITLLDGSQYSVIDAEGSLAVDGFDFEQVSEGEEY